MTESGPDNHKFRESSYRSRAFAYTVMAGVIAYLTNGERIVVPESGQGILGPWLMRVGNEAPDIRTHPLFTRRIEGFLYEVLGAKLKFDHPRLFSTKAETLEAAGLAGDQGWLKTRSCPRDQRDVSFGNKVIQCGVCSACLLRRMSIFAAGLQEDKPYYWNDLRAASLDAARLDGGRDASHNDEQIAMAGVLSHIQFAEFLDSPLCKQRFMETAQELAEALHLSIEVIEPKLHGLLTRHRDEWNQFVSTQGENSFILDWWSSIKC